jgi:putative transposase
MDVHVRTVERHLDLFIADPSPRNQLDSRPGPVAGTSTLSPKRLAAVDLAIEDRHESEQRYSIAKTAREANRHAHNLGVKLVSESAVRARIRSRDRWKAERKRQGRVRGDAAMGPAGAPQGAAKPLDFVQMDHALVDLIVVDPITREEIGRPWITLAIDVCSRCILGFYLDWLDPSQTSVALALEHACCPKDDWLVEIGFKGDWLPMGLMKAIGWDHGKCFKPDSLVRNCDQAGIKPHPRRVKTPPDGAFIERYIGTYMGEIHLLCGTTHSNSKQRGDYPSQKRATMSLPELILWTCHQIALYHNTPHGGLKEKTPLQVWTAARTINGRYQIPSFPADRRKFRISLLPGKWRRVSREGVSRFDEYYWSDSLLPMVRDGNRYWIAHDPRNISQVHLQLGSDFLDVPWRDTEQPPVSLHEFQRAKRAVRADPSADQSKAAVFHHLNQMREIEDHAAKTTRTARRERACRPPAPKVARPASDIDYARPPKLYED